MNKYKEIIEKICKELNIEKENKYVFERKRNGMAVRKPNYVKPGFLEPDRTLLRTHAAASR